MSGYDDNSGKAGESQMRENPLLKSMNERREAEAKARAERAVTGDELAYQQGMAGVAPALRMVTEARLKEIGLDRCESPIERMFLIGLVWHTYAVPIYRFREPMDWRINAQMSVRVDVEIQHQIGNYRADFLLTVVWKDKVLGRVVVECDGHDYHERTKAQAARDRSRDRDMTLAGYTVMRFTGSELYRDLMACVTDAHFACWNIYTKAAGGE